MPRAVDAAPRKVAFLVTSLRGSGAEAVGRAWMSWFADAGDEVTAIVVTDDPGRAAQVPAIRTHRPARRASLPVRVRALRAFLRRGGFDAVIALQTYPNLLAVAATWRLGRARPVVVLSEHDLMILNRSDARLSRRAMVSLAKRWYRRADVVVSTSHAVGAAVATGFGVPASRSLVVPTPALAGVASAAPVSRSSGADRGLQLVLAGRLVSEESARAALGAARILRGRGMATEVVSFARGPVKDEMVALASSWGIPYSAREWGEDWFRHLADDAVVVSPSRREGLGSILIEAAAHGVPSVAVSTALDVADAVIPGVTGELALDDEPESIADAVARAAELPMQGIDDWLSRFTHETSGALLSDAVAYAESLAAARV